jgi:hypothetical protein
MEAELGLESRLAEEVEDGFVRVKAKDGKNYICKLVYSADIKKQGINEYLEIKYKEKKRLKEKSIKEISSDKLNFDFWFETEIPNQKSTKPLLTEVRVVITSYTLNFYKIIKEM